MDFDVIIIGGGVTGSAIARYLSKYDLKLGLFEKNEDVCTGTSKANSGIVHSGYDPEPGTAKAKFNLRGAQLVKELSKELDFDYSQNGSLIICDDKNALPQLQELYERGLKNGVKDMKILNQVEVHELEPNLNDNIIAALHCPTGGIVCPFGLTIALAENAFVNGCEFHFNKEVKTVTKEADGYKVVFRDNTVVNSKVVVNAAGLYADVIHNMVSENKLEIKPGRGNYMLLDKEVGGYVHNTVFQLPTALGKGVLVSPTVHGNLLMGPTSVANDDKEDTATYAQDLDSIKKDAAKSVKTLMMNKIITSFSGLRAHEKNGDFIVGECPDSPLFFDAAGIDSPGLTSAPAIGEYLAKEIAERLALKEKANFISRRKGFIKLASLPLNQRKDLIKQNPSYGVIVCRCEEISEGEILDSIRRPLGATTLDGVKRRVRAGMGRCQAGFCLPRTMEILSQELKVPMEKIAKNEAGSEVLYEA